MIFCQKLKTKEKTETILSSIQACVLTHSSGDFRDKSIVSVFFLISLYFALYFYVSSIILRKNRNTDFPDVCIHIYVRVYIYTHIYIHAYVCIHMYTYICICLYYIHIYAYVYIYIYIWIYLSIYLHTYKSLLVCVYIYIYTHIYICVLRFQLEYSTVISSCDFAKWNIRVKN